MILREKFMLLRSYGERTALGFADDSGEQITERSYCRLADDIDIISSYLCEQGYTGQRIAVIGKNSYAWLCGLYGILNTGNTAVVLSKDQNSAELDLYGDSLTCALLLYEQEMADKLPRNRKAVCIDQLLAARTVSPDLDTLVQQANSRINGDSTAVITFTSGTTGSQKAVMHSHCQLLNHWAFGPDQTEIQSFRGYLVLPFHHVISLMLVLEITFEGGSLFISSSPKYFLRDLALFKVTHTILVPQLLLLLGRVLAGGAPQYAALSKVYVAGAKLSPQSLQVFADNNVMLYQVYALTESGGDGSFCQVQPDAPDNIGRPFGSTRIKINPNGTIAISSQRVMQGYFNEPELTAEVLRDGWLHTGDLGYFDENGDLHITGRINNLIILSNGENISPEEIEVRLAECPLIAELVVYEERDRLGVKIFPAVPANREQDEIKKGIEQFISNYNLQVPSYRQIRSISYRETEFPKTAVGKIKRYL